METKGKGGILGYGGTVMVVQAVGRIRKVKQAQMDRNHIENVLGTANSISNGANKVQKRGV